MTHFMKLPSLPPLKTSEPYPLFNRLSIETSSRCNRRCSFCPVSTGRRDFPVQYMSDEMFTEICTELWNNDWDGFVQMFLLNEPLIDPNLKRRARELREVMPKGSIYISTNSDVILAQKDPLQYLSEIYDSGINMINMNIYDVGEKGVEVAKRLDEIVEMGHIVDEFEYTQKKYNKHSAKKRWITITDMRLDRPEDNASSTDKFHKRTSEDRIGEKVQHAYCARPHRHMIVQWDGKIPLCCAIDPTANDGIIVGDLKVDDLFDIWNNEMMMKYRWYLQQRSRSLPGCDTCSHHMSYPHIVRKVKPTEEEKARWLADVTLET